MYELKGQYIDGKWKNSTDGKQVTVINPSTEQVIGTCCSASIEDTQAAILSAEAGLSVWAEYTPWERSNIIRRVADLMRERIEANALITVLETGKPLAQAQGEWTIAVEQFEWYAEETKRIYGRTVQSRLADAHIRIDHSPVGVVAAFPAWNFPVALSARKIAPALAAGCSVICRPSSETPASVAAIIDCCHDAGVPAGVVSLLVGSASTTSPVLLQSPIVRKISLTGSTPLGKQLAGEAAETLKKVTMELGGHSPCIIYDDADVDAAINAAVKTKFANCGQVCVSPNRFFVQSAVFEQFTTGFAEQTAKLIVGNVLEIDAQVGPLRTSKRLEEVDALVRDAIERGAQVLTGGQRVECEQGYFYQPTVLINVPNEALLMREESFGPVAVINSFNDQQEVIKQANDTDYGLAAYVWSQSLHRATTTAAKIESGMVGVNTFALASAETPFGGIKESGYGREGGSEGIKEYLNTKYTHFVTQV